MLKFIEFETRSQRRVKCRGVALRAQADMGPTDRREMADRMARGWSDAQTQAAAQEGARTIGSRWGGHVSGGHVSGRMRVREGCARARTCRQRGGGQVYRPPPRSSRRRGRKDVHAPWR